MAHRTDGRSNFLTLKYSY